MESPKTSADSSKVRLGKLVKSIGLQGNILLEPESGIIGLDGAKVLYEHRDGRYFPHFLNTWSIPDQGAHWVLDFEDIDSPEKARALCGLDIWTDESNLILADSDDERDEFIGYEIRDQDDQPIGPILEVLDNNGQWLAVVRYQKREIFIPLADENILAVQDQERYLMVEIPDGLLDL